MRISDWSSDVCSSDLGRTAWAGDSAGRRPCAACRGTVAAAGGLNTASRWGNPDPIASVSATWHRGLRRFHRPPVRTILVPSAYDRSEEHTSELQSLMRISYAVFFLKKDKISCKPAEHRLIY